MAPYTGKRCAVCGERKSPHICGGTAYTRGWFDRAGGGSEGERRRETDKIIQITDTLTDDGEGQTLGLSEGGRVYQYKYDLESHPEAHPVTGRENWHKIINQRWELLLESPKL